MGVSAVFIDGGYVDKILVGTRIDYAKLAAEMAALGGSTLLAHYPQSGPGRVTTAG